MGRECFPWLGVLAPLPLLPHRCRARPPYLCPGEEGHGELQQPRDLDLHRGQ